MKKIRNHLFILVAFLVYNFANAQYIQVDNSYTVEQLVEDILIKNSCASVSNISVSGFDFGTGKSYAYFSGGTSTFPFSEGIILSTGRAASAIGPNNSILSEGPTSWRGDSDLQDALQIGNTSINATVLEFDFLPLGDKISFDYIFSSEQYLSNPSPNQCNYTDGFVFLLKEANTSNPYQNLAVLPGTNIPVLTNTVRGSGTICPAANEQYFDAFNGVQHPTNFNGQTVIMKAESAVVPGTLYHIKLVVADQGNNLYDSAIFLGGGSFSIETNLGQDRLVANGTSLCENETLELNAFNANATAYRWFKDGALQTSNATYTVTESGTYEVIVDFVGGCSSTGTIIVEYSNPNPSNATLVQCDDDNDGLALFNLNLANAQITATDPNANDITFYRDSAATDLITNDTAFENTQSIVYAKAANQQGCFKVIEIYLSVSNNSLQNPNALNECDVDANSQDGFTIFNLHETENEILANLPSGSVNYFISEEDALADLNPIQNPDRFINTIAFQQTIYAKLSDGSDCFGIVSFQINVNSFGASLNDENRIICSGSSIFLDAGNGFSSYEWDTQNAISQVISISEPGIYKVKVTNSFNCEGIKTFYVTSSSVAEIVSVTVNDFNGGNNTATLNLSTNSIGDYEYSIDGITFQDSPVFVNLPSGEYFAYASDKNLCGDAIPFSFFVMDYPKFFTPNNDGYNDFWQIPYLENQPNASVSLFDRYGKLIYFFKGNQRGWDGKHNGQNLPATDYWFKIHLENGRVIRGHFSLLR